MDISVYVYLFVIYYYHGARSLLYKYCIKYKILNKVIMNPRIENMVWGNFDFFWLRVFLKVVELCWG